LSRPPWPCASRPYLLALIDWADPYHDPLRASSCLSAPALPITPSWSSTRCTSRATRRCPGLTHRYPDKALFLPLDTCPVYCRFCTRSYAVGPDTEEVEKVSLKANSRWSRPSQYMRERPELEDIVISGGDVLQPARRAGHRDRQPPARHAEHPPHALRDEGPRGDAAEVLTDPWLDASRAS
jgi:lysine 2,3-aminomutase